MDKPLLLEDISSSAARIAARAINDHLAGRILAAGVAQAAKLGVPVNIAVLDAGAHLKAFVRMDGAVLGSIDLAMRKAKTAALFAVPSDAVWDYCKPGAPAPALEHSNGGLAPFAGGIPIKSTSGALLGAVGVSGGAVSQDQEIAAAAANAFAS